MKKIPSSHILHKSQTLSVGPAIHADFYVEQGVINKVDLSLSSHKGFSWCIYGASTEDPIHAAIASWIEQYCSKKMAKASPPVSLDTLPPHTKRVLETLAKVPFGSTTTYGELAAASGSPNGARAVGGACGRNPVPLLIPCHRVLAAGGALGGFSQGLEVKRRLLAFEK